MKKFIIFLAIASLMSCKEGTTEDKSKPNSVKPDIKKTDINKPAETKPSQPIVQVPAPVAINLEVKALVEGDKAIGDNEIDLIVGNKSGDTIEITKVEFKNPNAKVAHSDDFQSFVIKDGEGPFAIPLLVKVADITGPVALDEPFTITYKEGTKELSTEGHIKGSVNWVSEADLNNEPKLDIKPLGDPEIKGFKIHYGFSVENQSKYLVSFNRRSFLKDNSGVSDHFEIDKSKTTCLPKDDWQNESSLAAAKNCELYIIVTNHKHLVKFNLKYTLLGKPFEADFMIDIK